MGKGKGLAIKTGTASVLFGVHQFVWHPWTVAQSWRRLYGVWPLWHEWVAIFTHDLGYVGCEQMDDEKGREHPLFGAKLAEAIVWRLHGYGTTLRHPVRSFLDENFRMQKWWDGFRLGRRAYRLALGHSRFFAKRHGREVSSLFRADKLCTRFDPIWFYLLRAKASGEVYEYVSRSPLGYVTPEYWAHWYFNVVEEKFA